MTMSLPPDPRAAEVSSLGLATVTSEPGTPAPGTLPEGKPRSAFRRGLDIHAMTASQVFGVPFEGMDPATRRRAKAINFGIIYGISAYGLANQLQVPQEEARAYISAYFERFPAVRDRIDAARPGKRRRQRSSEVDIIDHGLGQDLGRALGRLHPVARLAQDRREHRRRWDD